MCRSASSVAEPADRKTAKVPGMGCLGHRPSDTSGALPQAPSAAPLRPGSFKNPSLNIQPDYKQHQANDEYEAGCVQRDNEFFVGRPAADAFVSEKNEVPAVE